MSDAESGKKKRLMAGVGCLAVTLLCCCPCAGGFGFVGGPTLSARATVSDFIEAAGEGRSHEAYALMSDGYRSTHNDFRFSAGLRRCRPLFDADSVSIEPAPASLISERVSMGLEPRGSSARYDVTLVKDPDGWRIDRLSSWSARTGAGCRIDSAGP